MVATRHESELTMHDRLHMPRSRGAASGLLIVLLGIWGGLVPFVGPAFGYSFTPDITWHWTMGRLWLEVLPAAATVLGGLAVMGSASRISGSAGAWLAAAGGAWFVTGQWFSMLWNDGVMQAGAPTATSNLGQIAEWIGFFLGLGVVIVFLAAMALGRMSVVSVRDARFARERAVVADTERDTAMGTGTATTTTTGRRVRDERDPM
ncbi:MAG TPA: hypothetical protein VGK78_19630 [Nocardioides sp.]|uniref:hypothetical protein n=1 Tax=Nocardioides sp. TaxID=35761 RepID=UPI002F404B9E